MISKDDHKPILLVRGINSNNEIIISDNGNTHAIMVAILPINGDCDNV